jgi:hypothetical protein
MKSRWMTVSLFLLVLVLAVGMSAALADEEKKDQKTEEMKIEKMSGKDLYKNYCKSCHLPDSPNGEYTPMTLIQEQWERFYKEKYAKTHTAVIDSLQGGKPVLELINEEMLKKIKKFSIEGAADSEHPMTCG